VHTKKSRKGKQEIGMKFREINNKSANKNNSNSCAAKGRIPKENSSQDSGCGGKLPALREIEGHTEGQLNGA